MVNPEKNGNMLMIKVVSSSVMAQCNFINLEQEHILKLSEKKIFFLEQYITRHFTTRKLVHGELQGSSPRPT